MDLRRRRYLIAAAAASFVSIPAAGALAAPSHAVTVYKNRACDDSPFVRSNHAL